MQPTEGFSVPRRALDVEDYIDILRRHKGWIFGPFLFCLVGSVVGGYLWPDTYISSGIIKVEPQQLPTSLVQSVMSQDMLDRINSMTESIESRGSLANIITSYNLYQKERTRQPLDDTIAEMIKAISIQPLGAQVSQGHTVPAFAVSFSYPDRQKAMKVTQDLIGKFMDENTHDQATRAFATTDFFRNQADQAKKELDTIENQLAAYKVENNGRLPEQRTENYQKLQTLQTQVGNLSSQISRLQQNRMETETSLNLYKSQAEDFDRRRPQIVAQQQQKQKSLRLQQAERAVDDWTDRLRILRQKYTDSFVDVRTAKTELKNAEDNRDKIVAEEEQQNKPDPAGKATSNGDSIAAIRESQERETTIKRHEMAINTDEIQIEELQNQLKEANKEITLLQARLNGVPQSEKDYEDLKQERDLKQQRYEELTKSLAKQKITQDMETNKYGETLEILNPASDPETPAYPNHPLVVSIGAAIGLLLGIAIAGAREMKDTSLKNLKDVRAYTQMAILGSIPLLENDFVVRRRRRIAWLGWTTACLAAVVLMAGSIAYYVFSIRPQ